MSWLRSRAGRVVLVLLLAALVNLPLVHGAWLGHRLDEDGVTTDATVVEAQDGLVVLRMPADVDAGESEFAVRLSDDAADGVDEGDTVRVRVLPDDPGTFEAAGQAGNGLLYGLVGFADVVLAGFLLLLLAHRRRDPGTLRLVATADVERARPGSSLERAGGRQLRRRGRDRPDRRRRHRARPRLTAGCASTWPAIGTRWGTSNPLG